MSEREAWDFLAAAWQKAHDEDICDMPRVFFQRSGDFSTCICDCVSEMVWCGLIFKVTSEYMFDRIHEEIERAGRSTGDFLYDQNRQGALKRAELCRRFAMECDAECKSETPSNT